MRTDPITRVLRRVDVLPLPSGCWVWTGADNGYGYGYINLGARMAVTHRLMYERCVGPIPDGLQIDHLCRNRACCNPDHLEPVTQQENIARGQAGDEQRAQTHCKRGHRFDEANTHIDPKGYRRCRACMRLQSRKDSRKRRQRLRAGGGGDR